MDPATGTFTTMDTYGGSLSDPMSLHKYLFANSNPVRYCDPSGFSASLGEMVVAMGISAILSAVDSGISYYLKYKDSDTAKYGKTVFGWNVVTAASEGFFKGFLLGGIFYALCSVLLIRFILSVIGLCLGIQQGTNGLDEIISSEGNTAYGIYNLIMGFILIVVSAIGIETSGAKILKKNGDGFGNLSIAENNTTNGLNNEEKGRTVKTKYDIPTNEKGYTKSNLELGRKVHGEYKADCVDNLTKFKEFILPSGKRVDYIDFETKTVYELKPYNPRQIKSGNLQLQSYINELETIYGPGWTGVLDTY